MVEPRIGVMVGAGGGRMRWTGEAALIGAAALALAGCASGPAPLGPVAGTQGRPSARYAGHKVGQPYQVRGVWYYPKEQPNYDEIGIASWYGEQFHNRYTADGEVFDMNLPSAAHKTLPLPSLVEVTNLANGRKLIVRVNDRGPFIDGRVIDMSKQAAAELGFVTAGVTRVRVRYVGQAADPPGSEPRQELASRKAAPKPARPVELASNGTPQTPVPYRQLAQAPPLAPAYAAPVRAAPALADVDSLLAGAAPTAPVPATYELQAGAFASEDAARRFAASLTGGGLPEVQTVTEGSQLSYRVVVHGLAGQAEAAAARSEAMALGAANIAIVSGS